MSATGEHRQSGTTLIEALAPRKAGCDSGAVFVESIIAAAIVAMVPRPIGEG
jgi:hypothetical protein